MLTILPGIESSGDTLTSDLYLQSLGRAQKKQLKNME